MKTHFTRLSPGNLAIDMNTITSQQAQAGAETAYADFTYTDAFMKSKMRFESSINASLNAMREEDEAAKRRKDAATRRVDERADKVRQEFVEPAMTLYKLSLMALGSAVSRLNELPSLTVDDNAYYVNQTVGQPIGILFGNGSVDTDTLHYSGHWSSGKSFKNATAAEALLILEKDLISRVSWALRQEELEKEEGQ